jgi:hypothetical protein
VTGTADGVPGAVEAGSFGGDGVVGAVWANVPEETNINNTNTGKKSVVFMVPLNSWFNYPVNRT